SMPTPGTAAAEAGMDEATVSNTTSYRPRGAELQCRVRSRDGPAPTLLAVGVLLAALSAVMYGSADFMGGLASRKELALAITWFSQIVGLVGITMVALAFPGDLVTGADWVWGGLGGIAGAFGLLFLYGALARGPMAVVAPVTALCSAM